MPSKTYAHMFMAALSRIDKTGQQPRYPSVGSRKAVVHTYMEYYSALKGNDLSSHKKTWREFKCT